MGDCFAHKVRGLAMTGWAERLRKLIWHQHRTSVSTSLNDELECSRCDGRFIVMIGSKWSIGKTLELSSGGFGLILPSDSACGPLDSIKLKRCRLRIGNTQPEVVGQDRTSMLQGNARQALAGSGGRRLRLY